MSSRSIAVARALRKRATGPETLLWEQLRDRRLDGWKFRRQFPIAGFVADFCCRDARIVVEVDGAHHELQKAQDQARRIAIEADGYLEIRFTNSDVTERLDWVIEEIRRSLDIAQAKTPRAPHPRWKL